MAEGTWYRHWWPAYMLCEPRPCHPVSVKLCPTETTLSRNSGRSPPLFQVVSVRPRVCLSSPPARLSRKPLWHSSALSPLWRSPSCLRPLSPCAPQSRPHQCSRQSRPDSEGG